MSLIPPPIGPDWKVWANQLTRFLARAMSNLQYKVGTENPSQDGILLWDGERGYPVVSKNGEWRWFVLSGGYFKGIITSNITPTNINTADGLPFASVAAKSIYVDQNNPTRIVTAEGGNFAISFSAQISSKSSAKVDFRFWLRQNGVDREYSTILNTLHNNRETLVVSSATNISLASGDTLEVMWAVDSLSASLEASPATSYAPSAPAATISIVRIYG